MILDKVSTQLDRLPISHSLCQKARLYCKGHHVERLIRLNGGAVLTDSSYNLLRFSMHVCWPWHLQLFTCVCMACELLA